MEALIVRGVSLLASILFLFSIALANACDPNEDCTTCLASWMGYCQERGIDPTCEARKLACASANREKAATAPASEVAEGKTSQFRQDFLKYDYAETKDLSKSFLTLVAAILVFSLTFSEKIVDFSTSWQIIASISCHIMVSFHAFDNPVWCISLPHISCRRLRDVWGRLPIARSPGVGLFTRGRKFLCYRLGGSHCRRWRISIQEARDAY
jgi:hypothetical protein